MPTCVQFCAPGNKRERPLLKDDAEPQTPQNVMASADSTTVTLTWTALTSSQWGLTEDGEAATGIYYYIPLCQWPSYTEAEND